MSRPQFEIRVRLPVAHFVVDVDVTSSARTLGVFGPSGAGKTSLVEAIAGWRTPASGRIRVGDTVLFDADGKTSLPIEARDVGYVPQDALLLPHWSVRQNVTAGAARGGARGGGTNMLRRTCAMLEIEHLLDRACTQLSGGARQRVALARALVSCPRLLLLDEPLGSLDLPLRRRILPYLIRVRGAFDLPTVYVSHDPTEVQALCEEVLVLEAGRVRARGAPSEVLRHMRSGEHAYENVLAGVVASEGGGTVAVRLDAGGEVRVPESGLVSGARAVFSIGSDEILVALDLPSRISARNVLPARIESVETVSASEVRADGRLERGAGALLSVSLTCASAAELGLAQGQDVYFVFKTNSCRVLSSAGGG